MCDDCGEHDHGDHGHDHGHPIGAVGGTKIVVVGKGGVGKTTLTAVLGRMLARAGNPVIAVDADEQRNLAATLGIPPDEAASIIPVAASADYVEEKTGARPGEGAGAMLRLNPDTGDAVERLAVEAPDDIRLLVMGGVARAGGGCLCPENTVLSAVLAGMRLRDDDIVLMDTHAGVEHFGRALARGFDSAVVVVEPTYNSVVVGVETARLAAELGIGRQLLVVNRSAAGDVDRVRDLVARVGGHEFESVHALPDDPAVRATEPSVDGALDGGSFAHAVAHLAEHLVGVEVGV